MYVAVVRPPPPQPHLVVRPILCFVECLLDAIYQIKMKWEPTHDYVADWCEYRLSFRDCPTLLMKGIHPQHPACRSLLPDFPLWDRWIDSFSPNIRVVLTSMVHNLGQKALILTSSDLDGQINIASLVRFCLSVMVETPRNTTNQIPQAASCPPISRQQMGRGEQGILHACVAGPVTNNDCGPHYLSKDIVSALRLHPVVQVL